jgi:hypothetical protein
MLENTLSEIISLSGAWQAEIGGKTGAITVPGAWEAQGYEGNTAVYRRAVDVPRAWGDAQIYLRFGAVSYETEVLVNGERVGAHEGLWTGFEFNVTGPIKPGKTNQIELRITKPSAVDEGKYSYHETMVGFIPYISTTFGGAWKDIELVAHRAPAIADVHVSTHDGAGLVNVRIDAIGRSLVGGTITAELVDAAGEIVASQSERVERTYSPGHLDDFLLSMSLEDVVVWSPAKPTLYTVKIRLAQGEKVLAQTSRRVGFRHLSAEGDMLMLNGLPFHLRGVLSWGWMPDKLAPIYTDDEIRDEFRRIRALGFNLVKLCLFVPPARLLEIADEEGMLLWLELPMWLPRMTDHLREQTVKEYQAVFDEVHFHPSLVIYSLGCELDAEMANAELLGTLDQMARRATSGVLVCDNSGSGEAYGGLGFDYADFNDYHFYADLHYFAPLLDHFRRDWRRPRPWIFGEFCDCDDYRNVDELNKGGIRPKWRDLEGVEGNLDRWAYKEQEARMKALNLPFTDAQLVEISRQSSFAVRKDVLEKTRARRGMGGYVVTGLRDTPISTSGMFDDLGRAKYDAEQFRMFNADTVLCLEVGRARTWTNGGDRPAPMDRFNHWAGDRASFRLIVSHAGTALNGRHVNWRLISPRGDVHAQGGDSVRGAIHGGEPREVAAVDLTMPNVERAERWMLRAELEGITANEWPLWVYPRVPELHLLKFDALGEQIGISKGLTSFSDNAFSARINLPDQLWSKNDVLLTRQFAYETSVYTGAGGRSIALKPPGASSYSTIPVPFWRESIKLIYDHPVMAQFPQDGYADLQFYHLAADVALDGTEFKDAKPIMRRLDARLFTTLDYMTELTVGEGKVIVTTLNLLGSAGDQVRGLKANVAGQFLLYQMVNYLLTSP